ncbi:MAG: hypothetical protein FWC39_11835 [Bacteroidetes bacterium]|nr:hypothetical protein [Bacteroidota bacterium]
MRQNTNANRAMETRDHFKNGASLKSQMSRVIAIIGIAAIFSLSSCKPKLYIVKSMQKQNEISISPELKQFLNNKQQISVVLRTPNTTSNVTQEVQNTELYNIMEKKLMNAGMVVRDRALLEKLVVNEQASYESIAQKVKADLIIEILENTKYDEIAKTMVRQKKNKIVYLYPYLNARVSFTTSKITFRIVLVETGVSSAFLTFYYTPCIEGCGTYATHPLGDYFFFGMNWREVGIGNREAHWQFDDDYIGEDLSNKIISILQGK